MTHLGHITDHLSDAAHVFKARRVKSDHDTLLAVFSPIHRCVAIMPLLGLGWGQAGQDVETEDGKGFHDPNHVFILLINANVGLFMMQKHGLMDLVN